MPTGSRLSACVCALVLGATTLAQAAEPVCAPRYWIERTLEAVVKFQHNPLRAARSLAYVAVGLDAAAAQETQPAAAAVAQHAVAGALLDHFYPHESTGRHRALARYRARAYGPNSAAFARGEAIAGVLVARALRDGAQRRWDGEMPPPSPGRWRAAPPLNSYTPVEPLAGSWLTWAIGDPARLAVAPPIPYDTAEYWAQVEEVWRTARQLSVAQTRLADLWHLDKGSVTPAGVWNRELLALLSTSPCDPEADAREIAALNVAMYDALVAAWRVKYTYWTLRPVNAIRDRYDAQFLPYLITPAFPGYVSGHACVSGAAAVVLAHLRPAQAGSFQEMAQAAADSRLYGGIHLRSDNEEGLRLGRQVGQLVAAQLAGPPRWLQFE